MSGIFGNNNEVTDSFKEAVKEVQNYKEEVVIKENAEALGAEAAARINLAATAVAGGNHMDAADHLEHAAKCCRAIALMTSSKNAEDTSQAPFAESVEDNWDSRVKDKFRRALRRSRKLQKKKN